LAIETLGFAANRMVKKLWEIPSDELNFVAENLVEFRALLVEIFEDAVP
jgi:hypothetical protein